jgi:rhodanese-related sulfurtransferase
LCTLLLSPIPVLNDINISKQIEDTNYLTNIRLILKCSLETVFFMKKNLPVLIHCSHGWDRTAQVTALSQLFLDPYYRSFDGFRILIEKEFLSFGHQFFLRCGHGLNNNSGNRNNYGNNNSGNVKQEDQLAPIFFQFLDCTWQLLKQHVHYFEFNARYLRFLLFSNFFFDFSLFTSHLSLHTHTTYSLTHTYALLSHTHILLSHFLSLYHTLSSSHATLTLSLHSLKLTHTACSLFHSDIC